MVRGPLPYRFTKVNSGVQIPTRAQVRTPFPYLGNSGTDCLEIWCMVRGPQGMRFTQDENIRTSARVTVSTHV